MPALLATSIGLGVNNGRAVIEALIGHKTGFVRTPKVGNQSNKVTMKNAYKTHSENWSTRLELTLGIIYTLFLIWAVTQSYWIVIPFLTLFAVGFFYISILSLKETAQQAETEINTDISPPMPLPRNEVEQIYVSAE